MRAYSFGVLAAAILAVLFYFSFSYWRDSTQPKSLDSLSLLQSMETDGIPDFEGRTIQGEEVHSSQFKGKIKVINFWASWCAPCLEEFPSLIEVMKKLEADVVLIAVSQDSEMEDINSFLKSYPELKNLKNVVLMTDFEHKIGSQFNVERLPESFVVGVDGKLKKKIVGTIEWDTPEALQYLKSLQ